MDRGWRRGRASADDTAAALKDAAADMTKGGYIRVVGEEGFELTVLGKAGVSKWMYEDLMASIEEAGACTCESEKEVAFA